MSQIFLLKCTTLIILPLRNNKFLTIFRLVYYFNRFFFPGSSHMEVKQQAAESPKDNKLSQITLLMEQRVL